MTQFIDKRKHRVLLIAEQANPEWVSVPLEGWSHSRAIAQRTDAHIITQIRNREAFLRAGLREGEDFTAIDSEKVAGPIYKLASKLRGGAGKGWTTMAAVSVPAYYYFEHLIWKQFGSAIRAREYDIVHRITPLSPTQPSWTLARKCKAAGVPFVWGPINGGVPWPKDFDNVRRQEKEWLSYVRIVYKLMPGYRTTRKHAAAILLGSSDTFGQMAQRYHDKCFYVPENAIDPARFTARRKRTAGKPIRAVFVGRLVPYKGADMLLTAAADLIRRGELVIDIIGDGPQKPELEAIIEKENLGEGVTLAGWIEHAQLQHRIAEADIFSFPSIREFGGAVVLEAMAVGVVPVVVAYGGPKELVTDKTGFAIPIGTREQIVSRFRQTLETIVAQPAMIDVMSAAALQRAHTHFTWQAKARQVCGLYDWLVNDGGDMRKKPDYPMPLPDEEASHLPSG